MHNHRNKGELDHCYIGYVNSSSVCGKRIVLKLSPLIFKREFSQFVETDKAAKWKGLKGKTTALNKLATKEF